MLIRSSTGHCKYVGLICVCQAGDKVAGPTIHPEQQTARGSSLCVIHGCVSRAVIFSRIHTHARVANAKLIVSQFPRFRGGVTSYTTSGTSKMGAKAGFGATNMVN